MNDIFSTLMKALRERKGLSARGLSLEAGLSTSYISKVENGTILPTIQTFAKIVDVLNPSPQEVVFILKSLVKED